MTGLDPIKDVILEVSVIITDFNFTKLAEYEAVIHQPDAVLDSMIEWPKQQHQASGLTERVRRQGRPETEVVQELVKLIQTNFNSEPAVLAGNSIHTDRMFISHWWPPVEALLHYRMLDVSSLKVLMQGKYNKEKGHSPGNGRYRRINCRAAVLFRFVTQWTIKQLKIIF
jgi:oligoribonuclease